MTGQALSGFRLARLELYNWGTFDQRVWTLHPDARNALVTGDIGSGKSTVVDAITTLLLPANKISYNKAAGADTRERTLRTYVLGTYKSARNEETGATQSVSLRDATRYSVILGVFTNEGYAQTVTIAQVFSMKNGDTGGQPDRFYVTADRALSVHGDFTGFGTELTGLRKRLRAMPGVRLHDAFPEYGKDFRRRLGIESEQAMELFHQTVSMKSVGNLTDFVREHMLEPFNAAKAVADIIAHFEDLTKAHEAVQRAQAQLTLLTPLLKELDAYDAVAAEIATLSARQGALKYYFADAKASLLDGALRDLSAERDHLAVALNGISGHLRDLRARQTSLEIRRAGHGGSRLAEIEGLVAEADKLRSARMSRAEAFGRLLAQAGLEPVQTAGHFATRRDEIAAARLAAQQTMMQSQNRLTEAAVDKRDLDARAAEVGKELRSLQARRSNIPAQNLELRERLCRELRLRDDALPFAGELIEVRPADADWEGAAERLLHGFALSILVPDGHYAAVSEWINGHHLNGRVVYYRVPQAALAAPLPPGPDGGTLAAKLAVKDSPFAAWVEGELARRADVACVETMAEFRRMPRAITKAGQIKGAGGRHEKDDRHRIDDRSRYVLGWSNERKIEALVGKASSLASQLATVRDALAQHEAAVSAAITRGQVLASLEQTADFTDIDWQSVVNRIADLEDEHARLKASSAELDRIDDELKAVREQIEAADAKSSRVRDTLGGVNKGIAEAEATLLETRATLGEAACEAARAHFAALGGVLSKEKLERPRAAQACDKAEADAARKLAEIAERRGSHRTRLANRIGALMGDFRREYPVETSELDAGVESAAGFRDLHERLTSDDLPRFQQQFKTYLNQNTIRDIAAFQSQLTRQADLIRERIATINKSLVDVEYNQGRFIRLEPEQTPSVEIRDFRSDLRACTEGTVSSAEPDDQYSEHKFLQVKRIIERFRGREGQTDADRRWTALVTDVRNWFVFAASERYREDDAEHERYADSAGKSGGQKEKLAYTILAASLAYQFKLEWGAGRSRDFRFAVIDEAFGRGSDESTRFALELFGKLGLQLLIVTPLQKIHVIEPYVAAVGFVDNPTGMYSRLQTLTIEEYRARREDRALAAAGLSAGAVPPASALAPAGNESIPVGV